MKIVGLTGGIGSGKTTVANFFSEFDDVAVYIADFEAKKLMNSSKIIKKKLIKEFGEFAFIKGVLNRKYIAEIVFKDQEKLAKLNAISHPEVKKHFEKFVKNNSHKDYIIYENAILFETKSSALCDVIITVFVDVNTKIQRVIDRDSSTKMEVLNRIKNQWPDAKKILQSNYIIWNIDLKKTQNQVRDIHNNLTGKGSIF
jgi:dephospho-CoA kinase